MPLVLIRQFCREVIGRQDLKVEVIGRLLCYCYFRYSLSVKTTLTRAIIPDKGMLRQ